MMFEYLVVCSLAFGFYLISLAGCGEGGEKEAPVGAKASLVWDSSNDPTMISYTVHYGKQSSGSVGSCN